MPDLVASVFRLQNARSLLAPKTHFVYEENNTGLLWHITAGGTRAYTIRRGAGIASEDPRSIDDQNADSHFMVDRVKLALLFGGHGLFQAEAMGRIFIENVRDESGWLAQTNLPAEGQELASDDDAYDWLKAFIAHSALRRAGMDAHAALSNPHEWGFMIYRGFEWLVVTEGRTWKDLAGDLGVPEQHLNEFKKLVNVDHGVRHASSSGEKLRGDVMNSVTWVCALFDAINATRARLEPGFKPTGPKRVAEIVSRAALPDPYPYP